MINLLKFELIAYSTVKCSDIDLLLSDINKLYDDIKFIPDEHKELKEALKKIDKTIKSTPENYVISSLTKDWIIIFDDQINSDGCSTMLYNLNRKFKYHGFKVNHNENGITSTYYLEESERVINAYFDSDKWFFYEKGKQMDFENPTYYKRRKISDRFNIDIFNEYIEKMGLKNIEELTLNAGKTYCLKKKLIKNI